MSDETPEQGTDTEYVERIFARAFVGAGGVFWMVAAFAGPYAFGDMSMADSIRTALWPFLAAVVILIIGWSYERLAALLLVAASAAVLVWGVLYGWEAGVWMVMTLALIAPMATAAVLYVLSARAEARRSAAAELQRSIRPGTDAVAYGRGVHARPH